MFDLFQFHFDYSFRQIIILITVIIVIYLISLLIPGVGNVVKHISHTITKYVIHPIVKYVFEAAIVWLVKIMWWAFKYLMFSLKVYLYNLTTPRAKIFPELKQKQIGVVSDNEK